MTGQDYRFTMSGPRGARTGERARWMLDAALAVACVAWASALTQEIARDLSSRLGTVAAILAVAHGAAIIGRRRWPHAVMGWLLLTAIGFRLLGLPPWFLGPALVIGLYSVATVTPRASSLGWLAAALAVLLATAVGMSPGWDSLALFGAIAAGAWLLGDLVRRRQDEAEEHAARARQLEAATEELARYAVTQERLRIARELHDIVAHSMSVVALNAGAARVAAPLDPAAASAALETIEATSRSALSELRHLLEMLRDEDGVASTAPLPGMAELPLLVAGVADAGLAVEVSVQGKRGAVPGGVDLAGYRIIQEALTNVLKHSTAKTAHVTVVYLPERLELTVTDAGPPRSRAQDGAGSGLVGMRERVALYGGTLDAGPARTGGFTVAACLPLSEETV